MRVFLLVLTWIVAFVVALVTGDFSSMVYVAVVATPLLLMTRPWLGCLAGLGSGVWLALSSEPMLVRIVFALYALHCLGVLVGFVLQVRAQRAIVAEVASVVPIDLPADLGHSSRMRIRPFVVGGVVAILSVGGIAAADAVWWLLVGSFAAVHAAREVAVRVLPPRRLTGRQAAVSMLVRAGPDGRALLLTGRELCAVASFPVTEVLHRQDVEDPLLALGQDLDEDVRTPPVPATVVGDFRVGGWVAVITDNCVLLPAGPLRDNWEPPAVSVPPTLVDGRRWSGLQSN